MKIDAPDHEHTLRRRLSVLSLSAAAVLVVGLAFAPATYARDQALRIQLTLKGPVPAIAAFALGGGTSSAFICAPASVTSTWPPGGVIVPPCSSGRSYSDTSQVSPGTRVAYHFDLVLCEDAACTSTTRTIWKGEVTMGRTDKTVNVTYTFGGVPNTSTTEAPHELPRGTFGIVTLLVAALLGLGIGARRFATRGSADRDV